MKGCGVWVPKGKGAVDHVVPVVDGGSDGRWNLWLLCDECHAEKTLGDNARRRERERAARGVGGHQCLGDVGAGAPPAREEKPARTGNDRKA